MGGDRDSPCFAIHTFATEFEMVWQYRTTGDGDRNVIHYLTVNACFVFQAYSLHHLVCKHRETRVIIRGHVFRHL